MKRFAFVNSMGEVAYTSNTSDESLYEEGGVYGPHVAHEISLDVNEEELTVRWFWDEEGGWQQRPEKPSPFHVWDGSTWVGNAQALRKDLKDQVRKMRRFLSRRPVTYEGNNFDTDPEGVVALQTRVVQVVTGRPLPDGFVWRTAGNQDIPATPEFLEGLLEAIEGRNFRIKQVAWRKKAELDAIESFDALNVYDVKSGWS